nr:ComF family protein [Desulfobaculum xiamenense]
MRSGRCAWGGLGGLRRALRTLWARCAACGAALGSGGGELCPRCAGELAPRLGGHCPLCGALYADAEAPVYLCGACRRAPRPWAAFHFHGAYAGALRRLVLEFKFSSRLGRSALLGRFVREACVRDGWPGSLDDAGAFGGWLVVPVPLHPRRLRHRGYNQSLELARAVCRPGCELAPQALTRRVETVPQLGLSAARRRENVRGAFEADACVAGRAILLVDDVMTTGGTLEAATRALLRAGAARVEVLVLARTPEA